jgi:hypothetical protein
MKSVSDIMIKENLMLSEATDRTSTEGILFFSYPVSAYDYEYDRALALTAGEHSGVPLGTGGIPSSVTCNCLHLQ